MHVGSSVVLFSFPKCNIALFRCNTARIIDNYPMSKPKEVQGSISLLSVTHIIVCIVGTSKPLAYWLDLKVTRTSWGKKQKQVHPPQETLAECIYLWSDNLSALSVGIHVCMTIITWRNNRTFESMYQILLMMQVKILLQDIRVRLDMLCPAWISYCLTAQAINHVSPKGCRWKESVFSFLKHLTCGKICSSAKMQGLDMEINILQSAKRISWARKYI